MGPLCTEYDCRSVNALAIDDSGKLYAGGEFTTAGGVSANNIAVWDGISWSTLGSGMNEGFPETIVRALAFDGSGNLYAGGAFTTAGVASANNMASWDGSSWSPLGSGMDRPVYALAVEVENNLYAGGHFDTAGGRPSAGIALWLQTLTANFSGSPRWGWSTLTVNFDNWSTGDFDTCLWDFGDGASSTFCGNPSHEYTKVDVYSVSLEVGGTGGSDSELKGDYITVPKKYPNFVPYVARNN